MALISTESLRSGSSRRSTSSRSFRPTPTFAGRVRAGSASAPSTRSARPRSRSTLRKSSTTALAAGLAATRSSSSRRRRAGVQRGGRGAAQLLRGSSWSASRETRSEASAAAPAPRELVERERAQDLELPLQVVREVADKARTTCPTRLNEATLEVWRRLPQRLDRSSSSASGRAWVDGDAAVGLVQRDRAGARSNLRQGSCSRSATRAAHASASAGRAMRDDQGAKYVNATETDFGGTRLLQSQILYGFDGRRRWRGTRRPSSRATPTIACTRPGSRSSSR